MRHLGALDLALAERAQAGAHLVLIAGDLLGHREVLRGDEFILLGEQLDLVNVVHVVGDDWDWFEK